MLTIVLVSLLLMVHLPLALSSWEFQLVEATNRERVSRGLPPLAVDPVLMVSARQHAATMARYGYRHSGRPGEIIASGQNTVGWVMRDWMESPPHRAVVLGPWQRIGVGTAVLSRGYRVWCEQFGG